MTRLLALLTFTAGFIAGFATSLPGPRQAAAVTEYLTLRVHPGPEARFAALNCSWHETCLNPPTPGNALDWANGHQSWAPNRPIFWRSYGYRSGGTGTIARAQILQNDTGHCSRVTLRVFDAFDFPKGDIHYVHSRTWTPGWWVYASGSPSWSFSKAEVGFSVAQEKSASCPWAGQHLHQGAEPSFWSANWTNFGSLGTYDIENTANWQYQQSWTWNY